MLVDHALRWEGAKRIIEPPSAEKLKVIHDLVTAATGLDTERGDQLVVEAFPFESTLDGRAADDAAAAAAPVPPPTSRCRAWLQKLMEQKRNFALIAGGGAAHHGADRRIRLPASADAGKRIRRKRQADAGGAKPRSIARTAGDLERQIEAQMAEQAAEKAEQEAEALMELKLPAIATKKTDVLTKHIAAEAKKDPGAMAQVVRSWLHGENRR